MVDNIIKNSMVQKFLYVLIVLPFLISCEDQGVVTEKYDNGSVKLKYEVHNGLKDGDLVEYYSNGKIKMKQHWENGRLNGQTIHYYRNGQIGKIAYHNNGLLTGKVELFYKSGELLENQFYDSVGRLYYFERFEKSGERKDGMAPIFQLSKDSITQGEENNLAVSLGNITNDQYKSGSLVISSEIDVQGYPTDTIALIKSSNNLYKYNFKVPAEPGQHEIKGCLRYIITSDSITFIDQFCFIQPYFVYGI